MEGRRDMVLGFGHRAAWPGWSIEKIWWAGDVVTLERSLGHSG